MYIETLEDFNKKYDTWIIAYCPDLDEFFVTKQRYFYWESDKSFQSKKEAIDYFENNLDEFIGIKNHILMGCVMYYKPENKVWLENTAKWYFKNDI